MNHKLYLSIALLLFLSIIFSCNNTGSKISFNELEWPKSDGNNLIDNSDSSAVNCSYKADTIYNTTSYDGAINRLKLMIDSVNQKHTKHTATYINCLLLADFVYANCSFQFLGSLYQKNSNVAIANWQNLSLNQMYELGVSNQVAIWCGDRTTYFNSLLKHLLNLNAQIIHINKVHTYPIVSIDGLYYIVDPYYPMVITNPITNNIADYEWLKKNIHQTEPVFRLSPRYFGESKTLISSELISYIKSLSYTNDTLICGLVNHLLTQKKSTLLALLKNKHIKLVHYNATINPTKNVSYPFAFNTNITEPLTNKIAFCKQYGLLKN